MSVESMAMHTRHTAIRMKTDFGASIHPAAIASMWLIGVVGRFVSSCLSNVAGRCLAGGKAISNAR
jgi:hypothetical protein